MMQAAWQERTLLRRGEKRFRHDALYDLSLVEEGFRQRVHRDDSDVALLERVCDAYGLAVERQQALPDYYQPTGWWEQQRGLGLGGVMRALRTRDVKSLRDMYENFFRDECCTGLLPVQRMRSCFAGTITGFPRRLYLIDALYRLDYWKTDTDGHSPLRDLDGPMIGNPFGVVVDGTLIRHGVAYQHACARKVHALLGESQETVVEIGGGFGGMAYYLLRDWPETKYINFDVPESIALASYYLLKAFPERTAILYGEAEWGSPAMAEAGIVLMPLPEIAELPDGAADVTFSSHSISDLAAGALARYAQQVARITRRHFLYIGGADAADVIAESDRFALLKKQRSGWDHHLSPNLDHVECIYRVV
jgi:hypothetical protein